MAEVALKLTPATRQDVEDALVAAWGEHFAESPSPDVLALMLAQTALETGRWQKMRNNNLGNVIATSSDQDFFTLPSTGELFRSYPSLRAGAQAYVDLLMRRSNWRLGLLTGRPEQFNKGLQTPRYYTGDPAAYGTALSSLWREFGGFVDAQPASGLAVASAVILPVALFIALLSKRR